MYLVYSVSSEKFVSFRNWVADTAAGPEYAMREICPDLAVRHDAPKGLLTVVRGAKIGYSLLPEEMTKRISAGEGAGLLPVLTPEGFQVWDEDGQNVWNINFPGITCEDAEEIHFAPTCNGLLSYFRVRLKDDTSRGGTEFLEVIMSEDEVCLYREKTPVVTCEPGADRLVFKMPGKRGVALVVRDSYRQGTAFKIMRENEDVWRYTGMLSNIKLQWGPLPHVLFRFETVKNWEGIEVKSTEIPSYALFDWLSYKSELAAAPAEVIEPIDKITLPEAAAKPASNAPGVDTKALPQDTHEGTAAAIIRIITKELMTERLVPFQHKEKFSGMLQRALKFASEPGERLELIQFAHKFSIDFKGQCDESMKLRALTTVMATDPGIFFSFCRMGVMEQERVEAIHAKVFEEVTRAVKGRDELVARLCDFIARRQMGDSAARWPLLWGPPGTGKSYVAGMLADALNVAGIKTACVFQSMVMSMESGQNSEVKMALTGSDTHWSNGDSGSLFKAAREHDLVLAVLDEVDKCSERDYLVGLLDPKLPLQDTFVKAFSPSHDIRHKVIFIMTANDSSVLRRGVDDPLWSRISPILVPAYSAEEIEDIVVWQLSRDMNGPYRPESVHLRKIVRNILVGRGKAGLREVEDQVAERLFRERFGTMEISGTC